MRWGGFVLGISGRPRYTQCVDGKITGLFVPELLESLSWYESADEAGLLYLLPAPLGSDVFVVHDKCKPAFGVCPFDGGYGIERCTHGGKQYGHCKAYYEPTTLTIDNVGRFGRDICLTEDVAQRLVERGNAK